MNPLFKKLSSASVSLLMLVASTASASEFSDIMDALNKIATSDSSIDSIQKQYMNKINDYTKASSEDISAQLGLSQDEWKALTKAYHMGSHDNTPNAMSFNVGDEHTELWSADNWDDALKAVSGGNNSRYQELKAAYTAKNPTLLDNNTNIDAHQLVSNSYTQKANTVNTALAGSQYTYEDINRRILNVKDLEEMIDNPELNANEKAAIDLNSRLVAETALIQLEALKQASMQVQMQAADIQSDVNHETIEKQGSQMINH